MSSANKTFDGQATAWTQPFRKVEEQWGRAEPRGQWEQSTEPHKELNTPTDDITSVLGFPL